MANLKMGRTVTTQKIFVASLYAAALVVIGLCSRVQAQMLLWDQVVSEAKKEGKVVVSIPSGAELRKSLKEVFEKRFAIELELVTGRGAAVAKKISDEFRAGLRLTDVHTGGSAPIIYGLAGMLEPVESQFILPEVKEAKHWWGGKGRHDSRRLSQIAKPRRGQSYQRPQAGSQFCRKNSEIVEIIAGRSALEQRRANVFSSSVPSQLLAREICNSASSAIATRVNSA
jgi:hypothetical protein